MMISKIQKWNNPSIAYILSMFGGVLFAIQLLNFAHSQYSQFDEGAYAVKGLLFVAGKYVPYQEYGPWTNHMPLSFLIPGYIQILFGPGLITIRYFSVFLALLALIGIWITARRLGGIWWAAGAVWIVALNTSWAKFYSQGASQVIIFCMLAWILTLAFGENLPSWRLVSGAMLAGVMFLTRINMAPVLVFLLIYVFWEYGWRNGLLATTTSLVVISIGLIKYWPGIYGYMLTRYPLKEFSPFSYAILLFVVLVIIYLWDKRYSFVYKKWFRWAILLGVLSILVILFNWNVLFNRKEGIKSVILVIGFHWIIFMGGNLLYSFWRNSKWQKDRELWEDDASTLKAEYLKLYFLLSLIEGIGVFVSLLLIPSDPKNSWLLGYSQFRIVMIFVMIVFNLVVFVVFLKSLRASNFVEAIVNWISSWSEKKRNFSMILYFSMSLIIISIFLSLQAIAISDMSIKAPLVRVTPFLILITLLCTQTLLFVSFGTKNYMNISRLVFDLASAVFAVLIIYHLYQKIFPSTEIRSIFAGIRSQFIPVIGFIFILMFWKDKHRWKKEGNYKVGILLTGLFVVLIIVHLYASIWTDYCVHCFQPYLAFFSQLGIFLLIISFGNLDKEVTNTPQTVFMVLVILIFTGVGYVFNYKASITVPSIVFLLIAVSSVLKLILRQKTLIYSLSTIIAILSLGIGFFFSPTTLFGGGYRDLDCDVDIINYYEVFGSELSNVIPEGTQVFWWGSSPVPLLYLPDRRIYPAQLNRSAYHIGGNSDDLLKRGFWNDVLGQQWAIEADYLIIKTGIRENWLLNILDEDEYREILQMPSEGKCQRDLEYIIYQRNP